jgi:hypothetical protein
LGRLISDCRFLAIDTGDGRFRSVADAVELLDRCRLEHEESGGVPTEILEEIGALARESLPPILHEPDSAKATTLASAFAVDLGDLLERF